MHLLSFAKNFLVLHAKLSKIHILQGTLPTYLTIHTYLQSIFLPPIYFISTAFLLYVHILFTYMVIHLIGSFMLCTFIHIYTHLKSNFMLHIHWKGNFCITNSYTYWKAIWCHIFLYWEAFSCHIQHTCTLAKHLATYSIYPCTWWTTNSHHLGTKTNHHGIVKTKCWPKKGILTNKLSFSCFLALKTKGLDS